ncbi:hypothetical protein OR1_01558 [Geobacter sp. OR-1]|uniref:hypothetical protein n=1 Tax=Geobacter sp. OR-1 TaxID=1266765 RepID=UPI00054418BE|nr:hypothetical protein [Geobacter sp. OR-1]GAM09283.1 hypothetical protein OR1_01558 [Geobacter sp. OR-1]
MQTIIELAILVPLFILFYQFYSYSITSKGVERQKKCTVLGIVSMTIGIASFAGHSATTVFGGLVLMMFGFRLIAHGLDRIDKKTYIDHFDEDDNPH